MPVVMSATWLADKFGGMRQQMCIRDSKKTALRGNRVLYVKDGMIYGECDLGGYTNESKDREVKLNNFLTEMGW